MTTTSPIKATPVRVAIYHRGELPYLEIQTPRGRIALIPEGHEVFDVPPDDGDTRTVVTLPPEPAQAVGGVVEGQSGFAYGTLGVHWNDSSSAWAVEGFNSHGAALHAIKALSARSAPSTPAAPVVEAGTPYPRRECDKCGKVFSPKGLCSACEPPTTGGPLTEAIALAEVIAAGWKESTPAEPLASGVTADDPRWMCRLCGNAPSTHNGGYCCAPPRPGFGVGEPEFLRTPYGSATPVASGVVEAGKAMRYVLSTHTPTTYCGTKDCPMCAAVSQWDALAAAGLEAMTEDELWKKHGLFVSRTTNPIGWGLRKKVTTQNSSKMWDTLPDTYPTHDAALSAALAIASSPGAGRGKDEDGWPRYYHLGTARDVAYVEVADENADTVNVNKNGSRERGQAYIQFINNCTQAVRITAADAAALLRPSLAVGKVEFAEFGHEGVKPDAGKYTVIVDGKTKELPAVVAAEPKQRPTPPTCPEGYEPVMEGGRWAYSPVHHENKNMWFVSAYRPHGAVGPPWHASGDRRYIIRPKPTIAHTTKETTELEQGPMEPKRPQIVCLCGSTRFYDAFQQANYDLTMKGNIVLTVGHYPHATHKAHGESVGCTSEQKVALDALHKCKIAISDRVLVLNVGGYIGDSTRSEIAYATAKQIPIDYLELTPTPKETAEPETCKECGHPMAWHSDNGCYADVPGGVCRCLLSGKLTSREAVHNATIDEDAARDAKGAAAEPAPLQVGSAEPSPAAPAPAGMSIDQFAATAGKALPVVVSALAAAADAFGGDGLDEPMKESPAPAGDKPETFLKKIGQKVATGGDCPVCGLPVDEHSGSSLAACEKSVDKPEPPPGYGNVRRAKSAKAGERFLAENFLRGSWVSPLKHDTAEQETDRWVCSPLPPAAPASEPPVAVVHRATSSMDSPENARPALPRLSYADGGGSPQGEF